MRKSAVRGWQAIPIVLALTSSMFLITACEERLNAQGGVEVGGSTDTSDSDASSTEVSISDNEAESLADRIGILDRGELLCLEPVDELMARYGAETLEEAFFAATGREFEAEEDEDDDDRETYA